MSKIKTLIILCLISLISLISTKIMAESSKKSKIEYSKNLDFSIGRSYLSFTDFATSPLSYSSFVNSLSIAYHKEHESRTMLLGLKYDFGTPMNSYNNTNNMAQYKSVDLYYKRLYRINQPIQKLAIKLGGMVSFGGDLRTNASLSNASTGIDLNGSLSLSTRLTWDISRTSNYSFNWWFIHINRGPMTRHFVFDCDFGFLGAGYRNGYTYVNQTGLADSDNLFSGYKVTYAPRFRTALGYQIKFKNHNTINLSYVWDAIKYTGLNEPYQVASHGIQLTFGFNTNNK